jgi:uncharacterized membrane protein
MKNFIKIEPVRVTAALLVLGSAIIGLCALIWEIDGEVIAGISLVWAGLIGFVNSLFVRNQVMPSEAFTEEY